MTTEQPPTGAVEMTHCGVPMVRNSWTGEHECADAFFTLLDEGALGEPGHENWSPAQLSDEDVSPELRDTLRHWRGSRVPEESR